MSTDIRFDLRLPIGALFTIIGVLLVTYGLLGSDAGYERSLGINVNVRWGVVVLVFGVTMLAFARRVKRAG